MKHEQDKFMWKLFDCRVRLNNLLVPVTTRRAPVNEYKQMLLIFIGRYNNKTSYGLLFSLETYTFKTSAFNMTMI